MKKIKKLLALASIVCCASAANAQSIEGQIDFTGSATFSIDTLLGEITEIDFATSSASPIVQIAMGDFDDYVVSFEEFSDSLTSPTPLDFTDVSVVTVDDPWTVTAPSAGLWAVGGFTFDLDTITSNDGITTDGDGLELKATGTLKHIDFDDTEGMFTVTSQHGETIVSFSSTTTAIPEPSTYAAIVGAFALGFVAYRRRK